MAIVAATTLEFRALRPSGATWPPSKQDVFSFAKRWTLLFLPALVSSFLACLAWVLGVWLSPNWLGANAVVFWGYSFLTVLIGADVAVLLLAIVISVFIYKWRSERFFSGNARMLSDVRAFAGASLSAIWLAGVWVFSATVGVLVLIVGTPILPMDASVWNMLWIYGGLVLWMAVAFFLLLWERYKAAFALGVAVVAVGMFLCAPRLGGITLRALGYGGGLPISVVARLAEPGLLTVIPERINGCLLLATSSQVSILHPVDKRVTLTQCHFRPRTPHLVDGRPVATRVDTIPRDDVLDIIFVGKRG